MQTVLLLLLFIAPTIQFRTRISLLNLAFMEPVVLVVSAVMILHQLYTKRVLTLPRNKFILLFSILLVWIFALGVLSPDIKKGINDIRAWFIPVLGFVALLTVKEGWVRWIKIYALSVVANSLLGILQYWTNSFRFFVPVEFSYQESRVAVAMVEGKATLVQLPFAAGLFGHANGYAMYLLGGLMIMLGYALMTKALWARVMTVLTGLALILSFSKTSIIMMAVLLAAFAVSCQSRRRKIRIFIYLSFFAVIGLAAAVFFVKYLPPEIFTTLQWRIGLWRIAFEVIGKYPLILMAGNGMELFGDIAYYWQPHNLYIFFLLQYGLPGLLLLLAILLNMVRSGLNVVSKYTSDDEKFLIIGVWLSILVCFLAGMLESSLLSIEYRMTFLTHIAMFFGLVGEVKRKSVLPV
jgi:hypothetical protein